MRDLGQQARQFLRSMRPVGIHLDDHVVAALEPPGEAGEIGLPESLLARAMEHVDVVVLRRQRIREGTGAVR